MKTHKKKIRTILFIVILFFAKEAGAQTKIVVNISNFENSKGVCRGCVFANAASFGGNGAPIVCAQAVVTNKQSQLVFEKLPAGVYAISVFHDVNNNQKMDKNFLGIPKEGYGASKNKLPFASAPSFEDNKFQVANNTTTNLQIKLRNL